MLFGHFSITMRGRKGRGKDSILKSLLRSSVNRCFFRKFTYLILLKASDIPITNEYKFCFAWACAHLHLGIRCLNWVDCCNEDYKAKSWLWLGSKIWLGQANLSKVLYCPPHAVVLSFIWDFLCLTEENTIVQMDAPRPRPIIMK